MGPVNWSAVILAAMLATLIGMAWRRPLSTDGLAGGRHLGTALVMLIAAVMLGHNFARLGEITLSAKPWLYFMQSGGLAIAFVIPAVWLTSARDGASTRSRQLNAGFWLAAYLAMGATFWALG